MLLIVGEGQFSYVHRVLMRGRGAGHARAAKGAEKQGSPPLVATANGQELLSICAEVGVLAFGGQDSPHRQHHCCTNANDGPGCRRVPLKRIWGRASSPWFDASRTGGLPFPVNRPRKGHFLVRVHKSYITEGRSFCGHKYFLGRHPVRRLKCPQAPQGDIIYESPDAAVTAVEGARA